MPEEEPVCDCEEGEPPDPDPGCCGADTCEENETCCNETTCVLTSTFQTDSNNCGDCGTVCSAGETCVAGVCTGGEDTCPPGYVSCGATGGTFILDSDIEWSWQNDNGCPEGCVAFKAEQPTAEEEAAGLAVGNLSYDGICCIQECDSNCGYHVLQDNQGNYYWGRLDGADCETELGCVCPDPPATTPTIDDPFFYVACVHEEYNAAANIKIQPCSQEECDAHVSTWMAEPSGEPNKEGLYKVKWILLDGCPGACCSDQPTQPEFVKKSELIDAPCKCGCS